MTGAEILAVALVAAVCVALAAGYPVALTLGGVSLAVALVGHGLDLMPVGLLGAIGPRIHGVVTNETLMAIPLFIFMGVMLERTRVAEDLLDAMGRVFGARDGALAEYLAIRDTSTIVAMPDQVGFVEAAAVPVAGMTALQALRDKAGVKAGQHVLVNGASGGVGTYAVQIAKALGAEVTGVCSTRNVEMVRALGADHVVDYTRENFTEGAGRYDVIIDNVGTYGVRDYRRVMTRDGVLVVVGSVDDGDYLGPLATMLSAVAAGMFGSQRVEPFLSSSNAADLAVLRDLMQRGQIRSAIDRTYPFAEAREAIAYLETGRARGKVVVELVK